MCAQSNRTIKELVEDHLPLDDILVIDSHGHTGSGKHWIPFRDTDGMLETMNRVGIDRFCVSAMRALSGDFRAGNDEVIALTEQHPDRFTGYIVVNPRYPDDMQAELERCYIHKGMRGIKVHPTTYVHDYPINGERYEPVWEFAKAHDCPVLMHAGPRSERHTCGPQLIDEVARRHPEVKIMIGHAGAYDSWQALDEHIDVTLKHDNLFLEISTMNRFYRSIDYMVQRVGADKVIFGSDGAFHSIIAEFGAVVYARITEEDKRKVLGLNVANLLKLPVPA